MKTFLLLTIVQLFAVFSEAYILPLETILTKAAALAGTSIIEVEQTVYFHDGVQELAVKETWLIEGDRNLKVTITGLGPLSAFRAQYLYNGRSRTFLSGRNRQTANASPDFFEKYLAVKSRDSYTGYLRELGIAPQVRLSRAGGSICFAIGEPSASALRPQLWIDQDFFRLMKIRFPSEAEAEFSDYEDLGDLHYPRTKVISWAGKSVLIKVTRVNTKPPGVSIRDFYPETLTVPTDLQPLRQSAAGYLPDEFYQRFR